MDLYFDRNGVPIDMWTWSDLFEDDDYKQIDSTLISGKGVRYDVSTVWTGTRTSMSEPPAIFETVVFSSSGTVVECTRYATEDDARAGHAETVAVVAATVTDPVVTGMGERRAKAAGLTQILRGLLCDKRRTSAAPVDKDEEQTS